MTTALDRPPEEAAEDTSLRARAARLPDRRRPRRDPGRRAEHAPRDAALDDLPLPADADRVRVRRAPGGRLPPRPAAARASAPARSSRAEELIRVAEPILADLAEATGETAVHLPTHRARRRRPRPAPVAQSLRVVLEPGRPARCTSARWPSSCWRMRPPEVAGCRRSPTSTGGDAGRDPTAAVARSSPTASPATTASRSRARRRSRSRSCATTGSWPRSAVVAPAERASRRWQARARGALRRAAAAVEVELRSDGRRLTRIGTIAIWHRDFPRFDNRPPDADARERWTHWPPSRRSPTATRRCRSRTPSTGRDVGPAARRRRVVPGRVPVGPPARCRRGPPGRVRRARPPARPRRRLGSSTTSRVRRSPTGRACRSASGRRAPRHARRPVARTTSRRSRCSTRCTSATRSSSCA